MENIEIVKTVEVIENKEPEKKENDKDLKYIDKHVDKMMKDVNYNMVLNVKTKTKQYIKVAKKYIEKAKKYINKTTKKIKKELKKKK